MTYRTFYINVKMHVNEIDTVCVCLIILKGILSRWHCDVVTDTS